MKPNRLMIALLFVNLITSVTAATLTAAEAKGESYKHIDENGMRVNMHRRDDSQVLWSADPKHGWVQTKEKHQNKTQDHAKQKKHKTQAAKH